MKNFDEIYRCKSYTKVRSASGTTYIEIKIKFKKNKEKPKKLFVNFLHFQKLALVTIKKGQLKLRCLFLHANH